MNKLIDRKVEAMSLGIRDFCKTKKARNRTRLTVSAIVLAAILIASVPLIIWHYTSMQEKPWQGRLIVLCVIEELYDGLFERIHPQFTHTYDMTLQTFEEKSNLTVVSKEQYAEMVEQFHLENELDKNTPPYPRFFHFYVLGEDGQLLYSGDDADAVIEHLNAAGFDKGGTRNEHTP